MSNTSSMSPVTVCGCCRGSGVAQYLLDDSGCPCGPVYPCSECCGTGEATDWDAFVYGAREGEHDTLPCPGPHECETLPPPAGEECA